jgi:hypothetical protein
MESQGSRTAESTRGAARAASDAARAKAQNLYETNKEMAVSSAGAMAQALRSAASQLDGQQESLGRYTRQAADKLENAARGLAERDLSQNVESIQRYARRSPGAFLGGAFVAGVALARFMKASAERRPRRAAMGDSGYAPAQPGFPPVG